MVVDAIFIFAIIINCYLFHSTWCNINFNVIQSLLVYSIQKKKKKIIWNLVQKCISMYIKCGNHIPFHGDPFISSKISSKWEMKPILQLIDGFVVAVIVIFFCLLSFFRTNIEWTIFFSFKFQLFLIILFFLPIDFFFLMKLDFGFTLY